jgi:C-terminal processing protease CtpA/Prc
VAGNYLPDEAIQVPTGGFVDENGKIAVEGTGVVPDLLVPATVESLLSPDDEVLIGAEQALLQGKKP